MPYQPVPGDIKIRRENPNGSFSVLYWHLDNTFHITDVHPAFGFLTPPMAEELQQVVNMMRKYNSIIRKLEAEAFDGSD